jgi:hypothetical protein
MRRRRQVLQVSTFPFLAVLLCAMGSLILLLLVIDRRAKAVARFKALQAASRKAEQNPLADKAHMAEWERRRQALHALLQRQDNQLLGRLRTVADRIRAAGATLKNEQVRAEELDRQLRSAKDRLAQGRAALRARRGAAAGAGNQMEAAQKDLVDLTQEVDLLEQTLNDLQLLRRRDQQTYSLVPYRGRRGDTRRPIYVECAADALIFHPERRTLQGRGVSVKEVLDEVERQIARQGQAAGAGGKKDDNPYLLLLVRPDGIKTYYRFLAALQGMKFDFGYEFVEQNWVLDFSAPEGQPGSQPWMDAGLPRAQWPLPAATDKRPRSIRTGTFGLAHGLPGSGPAAPLAGSGQVSPSSPAAMPGAAISPGAEAGPRWGPAGTNQPPRTGPGNVPGPGLVGATPPNPNRVSMSATGSSGDTREGRAGPLALIYQKIPAGFRGSGTPGPQFSSLKVLGLPRREGAFLPNQPAVATKAGQAPDQLTRSTPAGQADPSAVAVLPDNASAKGGTAVGESGSRGTGQTQGAAAPGGTGSGTGAAANSGKPPSPPTQGGNSAPGGTAPGQENAGGPAGGSGGSGAGGVASLLPTSRQGPPLRRPAPSPLSVIGNRDWIIPVECTADAILLRTARMRFAAASLPGTGSPNHPLVRAVRELIARRQATLRPGDPPYRTLIRFEVWPDGRRSYYLAYPALEGLGLPMARQDLEAEQPRKP